MDPNNNSSTNNISSSNVVQNPLLDRIQMPGETFKLPSCGIFYTNGELNNNVIDAEVHVNPMTVMDEILIKTPDKLFSGDAVDEVFKRCIPQVLKPKQLLAKDVDFLLLCLRKVSYGAQFETEATHNECKSVESPKSNKYVIDITDIIKSTKLIDPTTVDQQFTINLPNNQIIKIHPIKYVNFVKVLQNLDTDNKLTPQQQVDQLVQSLKSIIISVDEITDGNMIAEWLAAIKPQYLMVINQHLDQSVQWGPNFTSNVKCVDCAQVMEVAIPLNPLVFFT